MAVSPAALSYEQPLKYFSFRSGNFWIKNIFFSFNNFRASQRLFRRRFWAKLGLVFHGQFEAIPQSRI